MSSPGSQEDIQALIDALNDENAVEPVPDVVLPYYFDNLTEEPIESDNSSESIERNNDEYRNSPAILNR